MNEAIEPTRPELGPGDRLLLLAALAGPLAWFAQLCVGIAIVGDLCAAQTRWPFHATTAVALVACLAGTIVCWRRRPSARTTYDVPRRACASAGVLLGAFFALVIVALEIPGVVLDPCL